MAVLYLYVGLHRQAVVHHGVLDADATFLQKPFTPDVLARMVRDRLNRGGANGRP